MSFLIDPPLFPSAHWKLRERRRFDRLALGVFATYPIWLWPGTRARR